MDISKLLTRVNFTNTNNSKRIKYIVIHYVGGTGDAYANCKYFKDVDRNASAHYFVGHAGDIWQCVEDADVAWHCGAKTYKHKECRNANSLGIEMCCKKKTNKWYFTDETVKSTVELVKYLMKKYNVPIENVIRHYDVTGKQCPEPYVRDNAAWKAFKEKLEEKDTGYYLVKVTANELNVRAGAGTYYKVVTTVKKNEVYTIVDEKMNGSTKWGKLKSGVGWISLGYTKKV